MLLYALGPYNILSSRVSTGKSGVAQGRNIDVVQINVVLESVRWRLQ